MDRFDRFGSFGPQDFEVFIDFLNELAGHSWPNNLFINDFCTLINSSNPRLRHK